MAIFDLRCEDCQKEFTKIVPYSKLSEVECPSCGSKNHKRLYKTNIKGPVSTNSGSGGFTPPSSGFT